MFLSHILTYTKQKVNRSNFVCNGLFHTYKHFILYTSAPKEKTKLERKICLRYLYFTKSRLYNIQNNLTCPKMYEYRNKKQIRHISLYFTIIVNYQLQNSTENCCFWYNLHLECPTLKVKDPSIRIQKTQDSFAVVPSTQNVNVCNTEYIFNYNYKLISIKYITSSTWLEGIWSTIKRDVQK